MSQELSHPHIAFQIVYSRVFDWLVEQINNRLATNVDMDYLGYTEGLSSAELFLGVLDIYGFEDLNR